MCEAEEFQQRTIKGCLEFSGPGIHTGKLGRVRICPDEPNSGIRFQGRRELIPALAENVVDTSRSTTLGVGEERIATVEHLMAALFGMGVDNARIEFEGPEVPILDGSAWPFAKAIQEVGLEEQDAYSSPWDLETPVFVSRGQSLVLAIPDSVLAFEGLVNYPSPEVGYQRYHYSTYDDFAVNLAPARTFGFWEEVEKLLAAGLGLGGSMSNALIFGRPRESVSSDEPLDELAVKAGYVSESGVRLRFYDEVVRHKVLDLMGDIALVGRPVRATLMAVRAGHSLHVELAKSLAANLRRL